jgi:hypothetical protein
VSDEKMREALQASIDALDDWLNTYASDMCDQDRVEAAWKRITDNGGTLAYIAQTQQRNREALAQPAAVEGWISVAERLPDVREGDYDNFIIEIKRKNGKSYVFEASYLHRYPTYSQDAADDADVYEDITGWFTLENDPTGDYDTVWQEVENDTDKITHWRRMPPAHDAAAPTLPKSEDARGAEPVGKSVIDQMVNRFLGWKLPKDFSPDHYINFDRESAQRMRDATNGTSWPIGTNLLTADQAREMIKHMMTGIAASPPPGKGEPVGVAELRKEFDDWMEMLATWIRLRTIDRDSLISWHENFRKGIEPLLNKATSTIPVRDREADRARIPDPAFNRWLDEIISDAGHTVWDTIPDVCCAWHGWSNRLYYDRTEPDLLSGLLSEKVEPIGYVPQTYKWFYECYGQTVMTPGGEGDSLPVFALPPTAQQALRMAADVCRSRAEEHASRNGPYFTGCMEEAEYLAAAIEALAPSQDTVTMTREEYAANLETVAYECVKLLINKGYCSPEMRKKVVAKHMPKESK